MVEDSFFVWYVLAIRHVFPFFVSRYLAIEQIILMLDNHTVK